MPNTDRPHMTLPNGDVIYEGEYGATRAGEKVGQMRLDPIGRCRGFEWADGRDHAWRADGTFGMLHRSISDDDIIAKWSDTAETPTGPVITETIKPYLAPFDRTRSLVLEPIVNGGWVVSVRGSFGEIAPVLGAFGSTPDMLSALRDAMEGGAQ